MSLPLVYVDHNIISLQSSGRVDFSKLDIAQWVYSTEHFAEISRSENPEPFLEALDQLGAIQLDLEMVDWKLTGNCRIHGPGGARMRHEEYLQAKADVDFDDDFFGQLLSWFCGGGSADKLRELPSQLSSILETLLADVPSELLPVVPDDLKDRFKESIEHLIGLGNDVVQMRSQMGFAKGGAGNIQGENPLQEIWDTISEQMPADLTAYQFFGFDPVLKDQERPITWLGIIACCTVLDIVGYKAEKKVRKPECVPNVLSDAAHIASGAYCGAIISGDKRLVARAKAIYKFLGHGTQVLYLDMQPDGKNTG